MSNIATPNCNNQSRVELEHHESLSLTLIAVVHHMCDANLKVRNILTLGGLSVEDLELGVSIRQLLMLPVLI